MGRASHLKQNGSLAGWLYTVAYHAALKANAQSTRLGRQQREITDMPAAPDTGKPAGTIPFLDVVGNTAPAFLEAVKMGVLAEETLMLNAPYGSQNMLPRRTDKDGNLTIRGLIPGMTYQVYTRTTPGQKNILARFTVESGKTKNVRIFVK